MEGQRHLVFTLEKCKCGVSIFPFMLHLQNWVCRS